MKMCLVMILVKKVFIFSKTMIICLLCPLLCGLFFFWKGAKGELSYKEIKMQFCISYIQNCISSIIKLIINILPADRSNFHLLTNLLQISQPYGYHHTSPKNQILHSCSVLSSSHSQG